MPSTDKIKGLSKKLDLEMAELKDQLDCNRWMAATNTVIETITSPEFVEKMRQEKCERFEISPINDPMARFGHMAP